MPRWVKPILIAAAAAVGLFAITLALAWAFLPREWIAREAQRQASQMSGASIRWAELSPGFESFSLGIRITGFSARMPATGPVAVDARAKEIFVRFRLLPLLFRRVEVSAASIRHASVAMVDRGVPPPPPAHGPGSGPGVVLVLPRLDVDDLSLSSRDPFGGGFDLRRISGHTSFEGALPRLRGLSVDLKAESLLWKPSSRDPLVPLPGPGRVDVALEARNGGARLAVTRGSLDVGPLRSDVTGGIDLGTSASPGKAPALDLRVQGKPQEVRSQDAAFRGLAARIPAAWNATLSWDVRVGGSASAPVTEGSFAAKPLHLEAQKNSFSFDAIDGNWSTTADQTYSANVTGSGTGVRLEVTARGSTRPGGASDGTILLRAPAARLNGFVPNAPTWQSGDLECRAIFQLKPPAQPQVRWTITGRSLNGTIPGWTRPVTGFDFHLDGDAAQANVRDLTLKVGSTTARVTGTVKQEKPLGSGTFEISLDRFVAEEWAPPKGAAAKKAPKPAGPAAPPPIPLRSLAGTVRIGEVKSGGMTIRNLVAPIRFADGSLAVSPIQGAIGTGTIAGHLDVRSLIAKPSYALRLDVKRAPVEQIAAGVLPFRSAVTGFLTGSVDLSGPGLPGPEVSDSLRGSLEGTVEQGALVPSPALSKLEAALGLSGEAGGVAFRTITHSLRIERGRLLVDKVKGDLGLDKFDMTGSMGLDQTLNLALHLSLGPQRAKGAGSLAAFARYARDAEGRIPLDVQLTGNALAPRVSLKAGKALELATEKLKQDLGAQLLKGVARGGTKADTARAARRDTTPKDALEKGRDALKRLLGK